MCMYMVPYNVWLGMCLARFSQDILQVNHHPRPRSTKSWVKLMNSNAQALFINTTPIYFMPNTRPWTTALFHINSQSMKKLTSWKRHLINHARRIIKTEKVQTALINSRVGMFFSPSFLLTRRKLHYTPLMLNYNINQYDKPQKW